MIILANSGGIGGGGLNVPLMVLLLQLDIKEAVPIGNFLGLIAAVIRFIINFKQRHTSRPHRLSIDYEMICMTMPLNYLGTLYGCVVEQLLSDFVVAMLLTATLAYSTYMTHVRAN